MTKLYLLLFFTLFIIPSLIEAHGLGNGQVQTVDGYTFEFGISTPQPTAGERITFSLSVDNLTTGEPLAADGLWIRISQGDTIVFASSDFRLTGTTYLLATYAFPKPGNYTLDVALHTPEEKRATFSVQVQKENSSFLQTAFLPVGLLFIGLGVGFLIKRKILRK